MPRLPLATRLIALIGLIAMLGSAPGSDARAAEGGQVTVANGSSFVTTGGQRTQIKANDLLHPGDVVEVMEGGKLRLAMADGSVLLLSGNSRLTLTTYTADPGVTRDVQLNLDYGLMRATAAAANQSSRFEVDTATAVATVRGTDFYVQATPQKTTIGVVDGTVAVVRRGASNATPVMLNANWQAELDSARDAPKVRPWTQQEFDSMVDRTGIGLGLCQCIADRSDIRAACMASAEDCRGACSSKLYSFVPDAKQTCAGKSASEEKLSR